MTNVIMGFVNEMATGELKEALVIFLKPFTYFFVSMVVFIFMVLFWMLDE